MSVCRDASAALSVVKRKVVGRMRHTDTSVLSLQEETFEDKSLPRKGRRKQSCVQNMLIELVAEVAWKRWQRKWMAAREDHCLSNQTLMFQVVEL